MWSPGQKRFSLWHTACVFGQSPAWVMIGMFLLYKIIELLPFSRAIIPVDSNRFCFFELQKHCFQCLGGCPKKPWRQILVSEKNLGSSHRQIMVFFRRSQSHWYNVNVNQFQKNGKNYRRNLTEEHFCLQPIEKNTSYSIVREKKNYGHIWRKYGKIYPVDSVNMLFQPS